MRSRGTRGRLPARTTSFRRSSLFGAPRGNELSRVRVSRRARAIRGSRAAVAHHPKAQTRDAQPAVSEVHVVPPCSADPRSGERIEARSQLIFPELEETTEIAERDDRDVVEAGIDPASDRLRVEVG